MSDIDSNLPTKDTADGTTGVAVPTIAQQVAGTDGTNLRSLSVDSTGKLNVNNISGTVSLPTGASTSANQTNKTQFTHITDGTDDVLVTATGELNVLATAQPGVDIGDITINNAAGAAAVNIQDGGNSITVDGTIAVTQSTSPWVVSGTSSSSNFPTTVDTNFGTVGTSTIRTAAELGNATGVADFNFGTIGAQSVRTAAQIGNATGAALFGTGTTTAQVLRAVLPTDQTGINTFLDKTVSGTLTALASPAITLTTNGMSTATIQLLGTFSATAIFEYSVDGGTTYNSMVGIYSSINLIPIAQLNTTGQVSFYVGSYTHIRVRLNVFTSGTVNVVINAGVGNLTGIATEFVRLASNMGEYLTSTLINSKQRLDVNTASEGVTGAAVPFDTIQMGGSDGTNLRSIKTDTAGNVVIVGTAADGAAATGNPVQIAGKDSAGNTQTIQTGLAGQVVVAPTDGIKTTYAAAITGLVVPAAATDVFTITGSATKTVKIVEIGISGSTAAAVVLATLLIKRSTANTAGTSTTPAVVPLDSTNAAGTAIVRAYTANPTLGTTVGSIRSVKFLLDSTTISSNLILFKQGSDPGQAITIRGVAEVLSVNLNATTITTPLMHFYVVWTEE